MQLAHNVWDPARKRSRTQVLYNFGRADDSSRAALERLASSLSRFLSPEAALLHAEGSGFKYLGGRPLGGAYVLDALWRRLGIDAPATRA